MGIQTVFPLSNFGYLLIAVLVFIVVIRPRWIVDIVPILKELLRFSVLLPLLPSATLPFLASVESIDIVVLGNRPVCK